jgi:hypothetical protein
MNENQLAEAFLLTFRIMAGARVAIVIVLACWLGPFLLCRPKNTERKP